MLEIAFTNLCLSVAYGVFIICQFKKRFTSCCEPGTVQCVLCA